MARIRSLKPEFWTDGKIGRLSDNAALFFVGIWTFADDYGFFACDTRELSLRMPRWRSSTLHHMLCSLVARGLVRVCTPLGVAQVVSWEHQKIRDRRASKWNDMKIEWDPVKVDAQGSDRKALGVEWIGEDRIGKELPAGSGERTQRKKKSKKTEHNSDNNNQEQNQSHEDFPPSASPDVGGGTLCLFPERTKTTRPPAKTDAVWIAYSTAYEARHESPPVRNGAFNGMASRLINHLGAELAPAVARFYVSHNDQNYVRNKHPMNLLLRDYQKLHTEMMTGKQITTTEAFNVDRKQSNLNAWAPLIAASMEQERKL